MPWKNYRQQFQIEAVGNVPAASVCNYITVKSFCNLRGASFGPCGCTATNLYLYKSTLPNGKELVLKFYRCPRHFPEVTHG